MERKQLTKQQKQMRTIKLQIDECKYNLYRTDYQAIKYAEGEMSEEEFLPIKSQRKAWRAEINRLEEEMATLRKSARPQQNVEV